MTVGHAARRFLSSDVPAEHGTDVPAASLAAILR